MTVTCARCGNPVEYDEAWQVFNDPSGKRMVVVCDGCLRQEDQTDEDE
jgi:hypothetical protein